MLLISKNASKIILEVPTYNFGETCYFLILSNNQYSQLDLMNRIYAWELRQLYTRSSSENIYLSSAQALA